MVDWPEDGEPDHWWLVPLLLLLFYLAVAALLAVVFAIRSLCDWAFGW